MATPGGTQLPLHVLAIEQVPEQHLVLEQALSANHKRERPFDDVIQTEGF